MYLSYHTFMLNTHNYSCHYIFVLLFFHSHGSMIMLSGPLDPKQTFSRGVPGKVKMIAYPMEEQL